MDDGDKSATVHAVVQSRTMKNKALFEDKSDAAGRYYNDFFTYIGPDDFDITALGENACFTVGKSRLALIKAEAVCAAGKVAYYEGILKRIWEEEDVFKQEV